MSNSDFEIKNVDVSAAVQRALRTINQNIEQFDLEYPGDTTVKGFYHLRSYDANYVPGANYGWTTSFWPGQLWLAYELTKDASYRDEALRHIDSFSQRVWNKVDVHTHDLGFLYTLSCVVPAQTYPNLDQEAVAREAALEAAKRLMDRYLPAAGVIQAWGDLTDPAQRGRVIIDSLMNMPLLFWATETSGDKQYQEAARAHIHALERNILREDDTTFHTFHFDPLSGEAKFGSTQQGHSDESCWARGQAWGILGFALAYARLGDERLLEASLRCADYYIEHLPKDLVPYWDLIFSDGDEQPRDSSAAAIAACGFLELAKLVPERKTQFYELAEATAHSLAAKYAPLPTDSDALLLHSVYSMPTGEGVDEGCLWGDYFYLELLARLSNQKWVSYWSL